MKRIIQKKREKSTEIILGNKNYNTFVDSVCPGNKKLQKT